MLLHYLISALIVFPVLVISDEVENLLEEDLPTNRTFTCDLPDGITECPTGACYYTTNPKKDCVIERGCAAPGLCDNIDNKRCQEDGELVSCCCKTENCLAETMVGSGRSCADLAKLAAIRTPEARSSAESEERSGEASHEEAEEVKQNEVKPAVEVKTVESSPTSSPEVHHSSSKRDLTLKTTNHILHPQATHSPVIAESPVKSEVLQKEKDFPETILVDNATDISKTSNPVAETELPEKKHQQTILIASDTESIVPADRIAPSSMTIPGAALNTTIIEYIPEEIKSQQMVMSSASIQEPIIETGVYVDSIQMVSRTHPLSEETDLSETAVDKKAEVQELKDAGKNVKDSVQAAESKSKTSNDALAEADDDNIEAIERMPVSSISKQDIAETAKTSHPESPVVNDVSIADKKKNENLEGNEGSLPEKKLDSSIAQSEQTHRPNSSSLIPVIPESSFTQPETDTNPPEQDVSSKTSKPDALAENNEAGVPWWSAACLIGFFCLGITTLIFIIFKRKRDRARRRNAQKQEKESVLVDPLLKDATRREA